jgi:uncharacterized protein YjiS (DUF1127 family)
MDDRITKAEATFLLPSAIPASRRMAEIEALRLAAIAARDEAIAAAIRKAFRATGRAIAAVLRAIVAFPERLATYQALNALTDRELRDIGMTRYDVSRVFEPGFTPRPANDAGERPTPRAA